MLVVVARMSQRGVRMRALRLSAFWLPGPFSVREYALVNRAGLSDETRPFKLRL
jgi:hypothetical protein